MTKKIVTIIALVIVLAGIAWGIYDMVTPMPAAGHAEGATIFTR